jgi:hypothetical protein
MARKRLGRPVNQACTRNREVRAPVTGPATLTAMRFSISRSGPPADMEPAADMEPPTTWIRVEDAALPAPLRLRLAVGDDQRLLCTGLLIDTPEGELTARDLRDIRLSEILTTFVRQAPRTPELNSLLIFLYAGTHSVTTSPGTDPYEVMTRMQAVAKRQTRRRVRRTRPGRRGYPDDHYRQVAAAYQRAKRQHPRAPIRALMDELHVSEPTVHRWLRIAVERGFLKEEER